MQLVKQNFENNIWKYFVYQFTQRRNFIPLLSIYFLTLPNTDANQIGIYTGIGYLASFLLQIPTGFFSDHFGHKNALIIAKICMCLSTLSFIFGGGFYLFALGSAFLSASIAFESGAKSAFLHETLAQIGKANSFSKIKGKIDANISFVSIFCIVGLPFLTQINILLPFYISLGLDLIGFLVALQFSPTGNRIQKHEKKPFFKLLKEAQSIGFFPVAIFTSAISGFLSADAAFRSIYLESLGYPLILIGFVMGFSRFVRFIVGHFSYMIKDRFTLKQQLLFEIFVFTGYYILVSFLSNPYVIGIVFSIAVGYMWGRTSVIEDYVLNNYIEDKKYKATMLSIKGQITSIFQIIMTFFIGFIMSISYKLGFIVLGMILFCVLTISYRFIKEKQKLILIK